MHRKKTTIRGTMVLAACGILLGVALPAAAQFQFDSGSDGSDGALDVTTGTVTVDLPPDGVLNYTTVNVASGATLKFNKNALNTPAYILASGDVVVAGTIDVSGQAGTLGSTAVFPLAGAGGPGGYDGGQGGLTPGDGQGPGGGKGGDEAIYGSTDSSNYDYAGHGAHGSTTARENSGAAYGSELLLPLTGGSGGGGTILYINLNRAMGGGGGGGAVLLASSTRVVVSGSILAIGGRAAQDGGYAAGQGAGGAIRVVAPVVEGAGTIDVRGGKHLSDSAGSYRGGQGWIRVDAYDVSGQSLTMYGRESLGANMTVFPADMPKLEVVSVAGQAIDPATTVPVLVALGQSAPAQQDVTLRVTNFGGTVLAKVLVIPEHGPSASYDIDVPNPGPDPGEATVTVDVPPNVLSHIYAVTR